MTRQSKLLEYEELLPLCKQLQEIRVKNYEEKYKPNKNVQYAHPID